MSGAGGRLRQIAWIAGWPVRRALVAGIGAYRLLLSGWLGGQCRFYPSCSHYAEEAVREHGALRGSALAIWRILRCGPFTRGGVDHVPPRRDARDGRSTEPAAAQREAGVHA